MSDYVEMYKLRLEHEVEIAKLEIAKEIISPRLQIAVTILSGLCANSHAIVVNTTNADKLEHALFLANELLKMEKSNNE